MSKYRTEAIQIETSAEAARTFISDPQNLPAWTAAFASISDRHATMKTPNGEVQIELTVESSPCGSIDWIMVFPDRSVARAQSRVVELGVSTVAYVFVLIAPPVALEQLEGALDQQAQILRGELQRLKSILEGPSYRATA